MLLYEIKQKHSRQLKSTYLLCESVAEVCRPSICMSSRLRLSVLDYTLSTPPGRPALFEVKGTLHFPGRPGPLKS